MKNPLILASGLPLAVLVACSTSSPPPSSNVAPTVQSAATQAAPTIQAAAAQAAPTVQAAAAQAAPTVQAAATQAAPTVQAAATQLAPTVQAAATQAPAAASTAIAGAPVRITDASLSGSAPRLTIQNTSTQAVDLSGWTLRVGDAAVRLPTNMQAPAGQTLVLHMTAGTSSGRDVYLGQPAPDLTQALRPGARIALEDPSGSTITAMTVPGA
jgi:hypothetical protein